MTNGRNWEKEKTGILYQIMEMPEFGNNWDLVIPYIYQILENWKNEEITKYWENPKNGKSQILEIARNFQG